MSEIFTCGDHGALVSYLYDECAADERRAIGAHLAICRACAEQVAALGTTREQLAMWTPPDAQLGFTIVSGAPPTANVLRPAPWWRQPMPAWAQAAAAAAIFATGLGLGMGRGIDRAPAASAQPAASAPLAADATIVTKADLAALEQRVRAEMAQIRQTSGADRGAAGSAPLTDTRVLQQVRAMIDESEQRQQRELALRTAEVVRDFDTQRNDDLSRIERTLGQMDGTTGVEVAQQRQMINYLMRVSQRGQ
jgi:hypothetical protein